MKPRDHCHADNQIDRNDRQRDNRDGRKPARQGGEQQDAYKPDGQRDAHAKPRPGLKSLAHQRRIRPRHQPQADVDCRETGHSAEDGQQGCARQQVVPLRVATGRRDGTH
jgi:hypothetical protein